MKVRSYVLGNQGVRIVLLADLHNRPTEKLLRQVARCAPDLIALPGDLTYRFSGYDRVGGFLKGCAEIAPTFVSLGNHDSTRAEAFVGMVRWSGAVLLDDGYVDTAVKGRKIRVGGLTSPSSHIPKSLAEKGTARRNREPNLAWLGAFCDCGHEKLLLCHQPEFYPRYLAEKPIDLVLSGHAHGGQWRIGSQGIYAPGQGFLPKLTGGVTEGKEGRLVISRGLANTTWIPRFFNPREIVVVEI